MHVVFRGQRLRTVVCAIAITMMGGFAMAAPEEGREVLFFGSDLTAGVGLQPAESFPGLLGQWIDQERLPFHVSVAAVAGETSAGAAARIEGVVSPDTALVVLEVGLNDARAGLPPEFTTTQAQSVVDRIRAAAPSAIVVLLGLEAPATEHAGEYAARFRGIYSTLAHVNNLPWVADALEGVAGVAELNQPDGIHPTATGQARVAAAVWQVLEPLLRNAAAVAPAEPPQNAEQAPAATPEEPGASSYDDSHGGTVSRPGKRPGRFSLGPLWLTPTLRIGSIGLDTNVFYSADERTTDVKASGGPGLRAVIPIRGGFELVGNGQLEYLYFAKTTRLRRLTGTGGGGFDWDTNFFRFGVQRTYQRWFDRPDFEVDQRIQRDQWQTRVDLALKKLERSRRLRLTTSFRAGRVNVDAGQEFLGNNLRNNLNRDFYVAEAELGFRVTAKTSLVAGGEYEISRFTEDETRDADIVRSYGGFEIDSETRLSGRAVAGVDWLEPKEQDVENRQGTYAQVELLYRFGARTALKVGYRTGVAISAFSVTQGYPSRRNENYDATLTKQFSDRVDIRFFGRFIRFRTEDPVVRDGDQAATTRNDTVREGGANLGYRFRNRLRIGLEALFTRRSSSFSDLGIQGLLTGLTVDYTPN